MNLQSIGWSAVWADRFEAFRVRGFVAGRIARQERGVWDVWTACGGFSVRHVRTGVDPAAGDWVALRPQCDSIEAVLPRQSVLRRRAAGSAEEVQTLAANVDIALIVMGLDGDFNLRRLERYLALTRAGGARPVVLLNKRDLCVESAARLMQTRDVARGIEVHAVSAVDDDIPGLLGALCAPGETATLLGSSGAGKSTLTNRLLGYEEQSTRDVREHDSRGRHTTTSRRLIVLPRGWLLMDMPGLREVGLWDAADSLDGVFGEITALSGNCRFRDCTHSGEPGCAVVTGAAQERLESWQKLRREARNPAERRRADRILHRAARQMDRIRGFSKE